jgi:5'-nucleotidase
MIHPAGVLTVKDVVSVLPYIVGTLVLECTGAQVVVALENGVSQWPKLEGRFPQVSGIKFKFDPSKPPGQRIVPGSVYTTATGKEPEPLEDDKKYKVAVTEYLAAGKDGFDVFAASTVPSALVRAWLRAPFV